MYDREKKRKRRTNRGMKEQNNREQVTRERLNGCLKKDKEFKIIGL